MVVPIGAEELEAAYLGCRADVFTNTGADVVVAYAHQSHDITGIVGQPFEADALGQLVTTDELEGDGQVFVNQTIHLLLNHLLVLSRRLTLETETHLALFTFDVGIVGTLTTEQPDHRLVEQMLGSMCRRKRYFTLVEYVQVALSHRRICTVNRQIMRWCWVIQATSRSRNPDGEADSCS